MADDPPRPIEFMLRGIDLVDALDLIKRWETLTPDEKEALGFERPTVH